MSRCKKCRKANLKWIEVAGETGGLKWILVDRRSRVRHECKKPENVGTGTTLVKEPAAEESPKPLPWWLND